MLDIQTIAANPGYPLTLAKHRWSASSDGQLLHFIDEQLRATVPPEGWDDHVKYWPASIDMVRQLRAAAAVKAKADQEAQSAKLDAALATLPAGTDPAMVQTIKAVVAAALGMPKPAAVQAAGASLADVEAQAAIATLKAKGFTVNVGGA